MLVGLAVPSVGVDAPEGGKLVDTGVAKPDSFVIKRTRCR